MEAHHLAVYTFNQFLAPYQSDAIKGFRDAEPGAFAEMERASGFIALRIRGRGRADELVTAGVSQMLGKQQW
ncbi:MULTISPECIES: hypothetical protein [unclassified Roseibium]|uniref:hypothetical protein n=1 Tax=unclassified Roseibium TaxID=2629323 RepID=UPI00273D4B6D|nr:MULTISPECIES: hypothetical protein [unclassified Roseibium]